MTPNSLAAQPQAEPPNVLFIAVDDLNDYALGLNAKFSVKTPHLQRLADRGVLFTNAHCAAPVCNPSRASVVTGVSPAKSGVYTNRDDWRENAYLKTITTLPQHFRDNGYKVLGGGKLYHAANLSESMLEGYLDSRPWHEYFPSKTRQLADEFVPRGNPVNGSNQFYGGRFDWDALDISDDEMGDGKVVAWGEKQLSKEHESPLFLSIGIYRPHIPWYTPKPWFDKHPIDEIDLPTDPAGDMLDVPTVGFDTTKHTWHQWLVDNDKWDDATQAYFASVSFADAMIGRILSALDNGPLADNTIIVLWSDHGYHLGHKQHWEKRVLWEQATHVPLIVVDRRFSDSQGSRCSRPVSLLDVYPTLSDACGLKRPAHLQGESLTPFLRDPRAESDRAVLTTYKFNNHSLRSQNWRYIRYADGSEELYDHRVDPLERNNVASVDENETTKRRLAKFLPSENAAPMTTVSQSKTPKQTLVFEDHFERQESQEIEEEIGQGWETNSEHRADGHKQVDLRDGKMHIEKHAEARHPVSVRHPLNIRNGEVSLNLNLTSDQGSLGVDFADITSREILGGHIFKVFYRSGEIEVIDQKRFRKNRMLQTLLKEGKLSPEQIADGKKARRSYPVDLKPNTWHSTRIVFQDDTLQVFFDGKSIGTFQSPGFAHPDKQLVRLAVTHTAIVDDVKLSSIEAASN